MSQCCSFRLNAILFDYFFVNVFKYIIKKDQKEFREKMIKIYNILTLRNAIY